MVDITTSGEGVRTFGVSRDLVLARRDLSEAIGLVSFWLKLGWTDVLMRYRGSLLGPLWITLTNAVFVAGLGPLYASLFGLQLKTYLPFLTFGVFIWGFLSATLNDGCLVFTAAGTVMKQVRLPRLLHVAHVMWRNIIIFGHNLPIFVFMMWYAEVPVGWHTIALLPGFLVVILFLTAWVVILGIACARFRDVVPIVNSVLSLAFFVTPVMWNPATQRVPQWFLWFNPLAAMIELIRAPLLGQTIAWQMVACALAATGASIAAATFMLARYRAAIVYWV